MALKFELMDQAESHILSRGQIAMEKSLTCRTLANSQALGLGAFMSWV